MAHPAADEKTQRLASAVLVDAAIPVMQIKDSQPIKSIGFAVPAL
jgi:hypothetical protein